MSVYALAYAEILIKTPPQRWVILARTLIRGQTHIDLPAHTYACTFMIMIMINHMCTQRARPLINRADVDISSPITIHLMYSNVDVDATSIRAPRPLPNLQCSQQSSLTLGADWRALVTDVQLSEGGVHLQARPTRVVGATENGSGKRECKQTTPQFVCGVQLHPGIVALQMYQHRTLTHGETRDKKRSSKQRCTCKCAASAAAPASPIALRDKSSRVNAAGMGHTAMRSIA